MTGLAHTYTTCFCLYRAYTRNGGHECNIHLKSPKNDEKGEVLTKKGTKWVF